MMFGSSRVLRNGNNLQRGGRTCLQRFKTIGETKGTALQKLWFPSLEWHTTNLNMAWKRLFSTQTISGFSDHLQGPFPSNDNDEFDNVHVSRDGSSIKVRFSSADELQESVFHGPWLWANDPNIIHSTSSQRTRFAITYLSGWRIQNAKMTSSAEVENLQQYAPANGSLHSIGGIYNKDDNNDEKRQLLHISWSNDNDGQCMDSYFDMNWLWRSRYDPEAMAKRDSETRVTKANAIHSGKQLTRINFQELLDENTNDDTRFSLLEALVQDGAVLVENTPTPQAGSESILNSVDIGDGDELKLAPVAFVGRSLAGGGLSHGMLYGDLFHVKTVVGAHNIAYTSESLPPHQDLSYYESPPGIQLLHCVKNSGVIGGESVLIDALAAADEFRNLAPDLFEILVRCEATFIKQREGADFSYRRPHIQLIDTSSSQTSPVASVHWSPPFEGPLAIHTDMIERYYTAYAAFMRMLDNHMPANDRMIPTIPEALERQLVDYAHNYTWQQKLRAGEIMIFNNERMLHGRRSFAMDESATGGEDEIGRQLMGCYTNIDDTLNEYRLLRRQRFRHAKEMSYVRNMGNGSCGTS